MVAAKEVGPLALQVAEDQHERSVIVRSEPRNTLSLLRGEPDAPADVLAVDRDPAGGFSPSVADWPIPLDDR